VHTYNSQDPYGQTDLYDRPGAYYGEGWVFGPAMRLYEAGDGAVVFKDPSGGTDRVYARYLTLTTAGVRKYFRPLYYDLSLTKNEAAGADPLKIYTLTPDSGGQTMYFDADGKLTRVEDRNGNHLTYAYDTSGRLVTITDVEGRVTTMQYLGPGSPGRLSKITDMAGRVSTYGYDADGDLVTIKHGVGTADEVTTTLGYGVAHHLIRVTNPRGNTSRIEYRAEHQWDTAGDAQGFVAEGSSPQVAQSEVRAFRGTGSLRMDLTGLTTIGTASAAKLFPTPVSLSAIQQELRATVWAPVGASLNARLMLRDASNRMVYGPWFPAVAGTWTVVRLPDAHIDPAYKVNKLSVQFQAAAGSASYTGSVWVDHVQVRGLVNYTTDSKPVPYTTLKLAYDWGNKKTTESRPNTSGVFQDITYTYDRYGLTTRVTDPAIGTSTVSHDEELRVMSATTADGDTITLNYHTNSNEVKTITSAAKETVRAGLDSDTGDTTYTIDPRNEELRLSDQAFVAEIYKDDANGNLTSVQTNRYPAGTDLDANPNTTPIENLRTTSYTYGAGGVMTSMTDPNGNRTNFSYDALTGYLTTIDAPAGTGETSRRLTTNSLRLAADGKAMDGSAQYTIDPKGNKTTFIYDSLGRFEQIDYGMQDAVADFSATYTYDKNSNPIGFSDKEGSTTYSNDENDQLVSASRTQNGATKTATYTYYGNGQLAKSTLVGGGTVHYEYDATTGQLISQTDPNDGGRAITFGYDADLRPARITFPSGVKRTVSYDASGSVGQISLTSPTGTILQSFKYDYGMTTDPSGHPIPSDDYRNGLVRSVTEQDGSKVSYGYDDLDRLISGVRTGTNSYSQSYAYDPNDNRQSITRNGVTTFASYDAANQLIREVTGTTTNTYNYDRNGNLIGFTNGTLSNSLAYDASNKWTSGTINGETVAFGYDGLGNRVRRVLGTARTDYWYDAWGMAQETGANNATYLRAQGGEMLSHTSGTTVANYATDQLGNVTGLLSGATLAASYTYDPWGQEVAKSGSLYNSSRYTGTYLDQQTGLYQMGARYYMPSTGRFTQPDPLACSAAMAQRYTYAGANPVTYTDPSGLLHISDRHFHWRVLATNVWKQNPSHALFSAFSACRFACSGAGLLVGAVALRVAQIALRIAMRYKSIAALVTKVGEERVVSALKGAYTAGIRKVVGGLANWFFGWGTCGALCDWLLGTPHGTLKWYRVWYDGRSVYRYELVYTGSF